MSVGKVFLVGAGPGDPGLLTLRGRECLESADVVLYDDLVDRRVLRFVRSGAELVPMGKRGDASRRDQQQAAINQRMISEARGGRVVVRLKGGDPFVFGRGGEEAEALRDAGLSYEIVPGVSSAIAVPAYAGIPVTHRGLNSSFTVVTGHEAPDHVGELDWPALAKMETLVFLMGIKRLPEITSRLIAAGRSPSTPAAAVHNGTKPDQQVVVATLAELAETVKRTGLRPPAVIVVGEVVRLRDRLQWFEERPLLGRRILITRALEQAGSLQERLEALGAETVAGATITIVPSPEPEALERAFGRLSEYDWIVFTSVNGVKIFFERLFARGGELRDLGRARLAAIGPATAEGLRRFGLRVEVLPEEFRAEGLRDLLVGGAHGKRILLARAAGARQLLPDALREAGAEVDDVATYRAERVSSLSAEAGAALREGRIDAVTFTSSSTVSHFVELLREEGLEIGAARIACIGPVTAETARSAGWTVDVLARDSTTEGLVNALVDYYRPGR